jgi:hypothetical protein
MESYFKMIEHSGGSRHPFQVVDAVQPKERPHA